MKDIEYFEKQYRCDGDKEFCDYIKSNELLRMQSHLLAFP